MLHANTTPKTESRKAQPNAIKLTMMTASDSSNPSCGLIIDAPNRTAKTTFRISLSTKSTNGNGLISASTSKQCASSQTTPATTKPATVYSSAVATLKA